MTRSRQWNLPEQAVTPRADYLNRRTLLAATGAAALVAPWARAGLAGTPGAYSTDAPHTDREDATSYNNFLEFGSDKDDPARYAGALTTSPWNVTIDGLVARPGQYALEDLTRADWLEERIYRLRCVETWAMVIPWIGVELRRILALAGPQSGARYVAFETLERPEEMRGQRGAFQSIDWPYREGLTLAEAMHPLTIMANGMYGAELPNQNGAPLRLVVPWKYGFKSIKSVVRITLTAEQPPTSWNMLQPNEYGFYANVNPEVSHPRWSQARERQIGGGLFARRRKTLMFNGYGEHVAELYAGMDLSRHY